MGEGEKDEGDPEVEEEVAVERGSVGGGVGGKGPEDHQYAGQPVVILVAVQQAVTFLAAVTTWRFSDWLAASWEMRDLGVGEDGGGEVELWQREDDAGTEGVVVGSEVGEEGGVDGLALDGFLRDGVDEIGAGVGGLVGAAEVADDGCVGVGGDGAELQEGGGDGEADRADGVVALEEGEQRRVDGWGRGGGEAAEDGCGEEAIVLRIPR